MTQTDDLFDDARTGFIKGDDLEGRLLLIKPLSVGERESTQPGSLGKMYEFVETDTVVLDGEPSEMIETVPFDVEGFQFSGARVVGFLKPKVRTGRMALGRLVRVKVKGRTDAWELQPPTDADREIARAYIASRPSDDPWSS